MTTYRVNVPLGRDAAYALRDWAELNKRDIRQQAAWVIELELRQRGLLADITNKNQESEEKENE
jgi:hypothetical protein